MKIRSYHSDDCDALISLFYQTIHKINQRDDIREQIEVWANDNSIDPTAWNLSFIHHKTLVAEMDDSIVGFGDLHGSFLDRLYYMQSISAEELQLQLWTDWNNMQQSKIM